MHRAVPALPKVGDIVSGIDAGRALHAGGRVMRVGSPRIYEMRSGVVCVRTMRSVDPWVPCKPDLEPLLFTRNILDFEVIAMPATRDELLEGDWL